MPVGLSIRSERMGLPQWGRGPMLDGGNREVLAELGSRQEEIDGMLARHIARQHS